MQRKRSREDVACQPFLKKSDIMTLFGCSYYVASRIFTIADDIDDKELGGYRIEPKKVRTVSVLKASGMTITQLKALIKN